MRESAADSRGWGPKNPCRIPPNHVKSLLAVAVGPCRWAPAGGAVRVGRLEVGRSGRNADVFPGVFGSVEGGIRAVEGRVARVSHAQVSEAAGCGDPNRRASEMKPQGFHALAQLVRDLPDFFNGQACQ